MSWLLALMDFSAAVAMISLMRVTTADFGTKTPQQRWAFLRRIMYSMMAIALFAKGSHRLYHIDEPEDLLDFFPQVIILLYVLLFPVLRATGKVSQDRWL